MFHSKISTISILYLYVCVLFLLLESSALSNTSFPHIIPVLSLLERGMALGETVEAWESSEVGVDVVMYHLEAARTIAHHGGIYRTNVETKLQGKSTGLPLFLLPVAVPTCVTSPAVNVLMLTRTRVYSIRVTASQICCNDRACVVTVLTVLIPNSSVLVLRLRPLLLY